MSTTEHIEVAIDGEIQRVLPGVTVLAALLTTGGWTVRKSVTGESRGPICGMGVCYECRCTIDDIPNERACMVLCRPGMVIRTDYMPELAESASAPGPDAPLFPLAPEPERPAGVPPGEAP